MTETLLDVRNLRVSFPSDQGRLEVVKGVSFALGRERLGIVGESGSGKSMTGRAILKLVRAPGEVSADRLTLGNTDLLKLSERGMRHIRGARISMIMQDPKFSLHPIMTIGDQIAEALRVHETVPRSEIRDRVIGMLDAVRIKNPEVVVDRYAHQVSGGMGQRIMIAMMLIPKPDVLIADEPTSALDVSVQAQVLDLIDDLILKEGMGLILISHDLNLVARYCDRVLVMNNGHIVETIEAGRLHEATHPYTRGLLNAVPRLDEDREELPVLDRSQWGGT